jgi:5'(3')-deoxyribonucleotidase
VVIFVDMDGVLADFDTAATAALGAVPDRDSTAFWATLHALGGFYRTMPKLPDADALMAGLRARGYRPIILTGVPVSIPTAADDKRAWAAEHFPGTEVITTAARLKSRWAWPGDVLIDDQTTYRALWEAAGGRYIVHTSAAATLAALEALA